MQALTKTRNTESHLPANTSYIYPLIVCTIYSFFSNFFLLSVIAGFVLTIITKELWRPYTPAALLYLFVFQWAQVFTVVHYMDFLDGNFVHNG